MTTYQPPKQINKLSKAFEYTLNMRDAWRKELNDPKGRNRTNFRILKKYFDNDPTLEQVNHNWLYPKLLELGDDRNVAEATLNRFIATVSAIMNSCHVGGFIDNPPKFIRFKEGEGRTQWYSKEDVYRMCDFARERGDFALADLILFALLTGCRQGEILRLKGWDVDWRTQHLLVGGTPDSRTKTNNFRKVEISDELLEMLKRRTDGYKPSVRLFDEWSNKQQVMRHFKHVRNRLMREKSYITEHHVFHTLRHSYGTLQIAAGTPVMKVKWAMGHSNVTTTERYVHNVEDPERQMANAI